MTKISNDSADFIEEFDEFDALDESTRARGAALWSTKRSPFRIRQRKAACICVVAAGFFLLAATTIRHVISTSDASSQQELAVASLLEPLSSYLNQANRTVYSNDHVRKLMDFAIIGHGKCGTTYLQAWLGRHPEISMYDHELRMLQHGNIAAMAEALYELDGTKQRGFKSPNDLSRKLALEAIYQYWPDAKLVVGVRHPITHFESWYNYNVRNRPKVHLPPAENMTQLPEQSLFHGHLSRLGKTNAMDPVEAELLDHYRLKQPLRMPNKVFLYDVSQIFDPTDDRNIQFATDFQHFLGLTTPMITEKDTSSLPLWRRVKRFVRGRLFRTKAPRQSPNYHYAMDICQDKYRDLRGMLLEHGGRAATWIQMYFLKSSDVTVSNPDHFIKLLDTWTVDPCVKRAADQEEASLTTGKTRRRSS